MDLLGFDVHEALIKSIVTREDLVPVTVGVFGDWGGGKSSVLRMLRDDLASEKDTACLYFSAWQFEGYDDAKAALLTAILYRIAESRHFQVKVRKKAVALLKQVGWMRMAKAAWRFGPTVLATAGVVSGHVDPSLAASLAAIPGAAALGATFAHGGAAGQDAEDDKNDQPDVDEDWTVGQDAAGKKKRKRPGAPSFQSLLKEDRSRPGVLDIRKFRADFEKLIAETNLKSLIILVDDLDRCSPERLIETLEAVKLFLTVKRIAFVIAADERLVQHAVWIRYVAPHIVAERETREDAYKLERDYLEKVIQMPYKLPRLSQSEVGSYITLLFCQAEFGQADKRFADVLEHCKAQRLATYSGET